MMNSGIKMLAMLLSIPSISMAAGGVGSRSIDKVAIQSGHFFIYASEPWNNANNCSRSTAVVLQKSDPHFDQAYALILAAFMAGKNVKGYSNECITWDGQTYNTIRGYKYLYVE